MKNMATIESILRQSLISMDIRKVTSNPIGGNTNSGESIEHYRCRLSKPGDQVNVYLSIDPDEGSLSLSDVLFMVAMDAMSCRMLAGYGGRRSEWTAIFAGSDGNAAEIEEFWQEYNTRCKQAEDVRKFLGDSVYEQVLENMDLDGTGLVVG